MMSYLWTIVIVTLSVMVLQLEGYAGGDRDVPCYFIFGDSLADNGNNNELKTGAKANYSPYGIDFPLGPTGRFTNGRTTVDVIAELLGFENYIPPFADTKDTEYMLGLNYASGSSGILDETGEHGGQCIPLNLQLKHHQTVVAKLIELIGLEELAFEYLSKCLYSVGMGNNDYINNYFLPQYYSSSQDYTLDQFTNLLIQQYTQQLKVLYNLGARKIVVFGLGEIGCTPDAIANYDTNGSVCFQVMNMAAVNFNKKIVPVVDQLNSELSPDAKFIFIDNTAIGSSASVLDFKVTTVGCCGVKNGTGLCDPGQVPCADRSSYAFWDGFHPTEVLNNFAAWLSYNSVDPLCTYPYNIRHLVNQDHTSLGQGIAAAM